MIKVTVHKTGDNYDWFRVKGHSGYADSGEDIVCASVSILSYTALNSFNSVAGIPEQNIAYTVDEDTGLLEVKTNQANDKSDVIYRTFLIGIELLLENYSDYITLKYEEV